MTVVFVAPKAAGSCGRLIRARFLAQSLHKFDIFAVVENYD